MFIRDRQGMTYASVEDVEDALDVFETTRARSQIRRVLNTATDSVETLLSRRFYPEVRTQTFSWYDDLGTPDQPWTIWLDRHEVISVTSITTGEDNESIPSSGYFLKPDDGPPYTRVELDTEGSFNFETRSAYQNSVSIAGKYGYWDKSEPAGTLVGSVDNSTTAITASNGALMGVGNLISIGTERVVVTDRGWISSGQTITADVSAAGSDTITVSSGAAFNARELIIVDGERMLITDVTGNVLTVKRAWNGSSLAAHSATTLVYVSRALTVIRGVLGTTAASHTDGDALTKFYVPDLVRDLTIAEAMAQLIQERTSYARTIGAGEGEREVRGVGLADLRERAVYAYGRKKGTGRAV
jgi:hypothetical protein